MVRDALFLQQLQLYLSPNKTEVIDVKWMDMKEILLLNQYGYLHPLLDYVDINFFKEEIK